MTRSEAISEHKKGKSKLIEKQNENNTIKNVLTKIK